MLQGRMKNPAVPRPGPEPAALALPEALTGIDPCNPVPDAVRSEATRHFGEKQLAGLVLWISLVNFFNRTGVATRQPAGQPLPE